eukprot:TRINITY_DN1831_c0_g1_i1.p2 TRINITY_DN1831_c0_g1~~TRINITY_DN1831_c0_g1_i1.p2  ORF type:complete len:141 (+),score=31.76 TRINITY_DN1831_c0_g1_i1:1630-2052(+)
MPGVRSYLKIGAVPPNISRKKAKLSLKHPTATLKKRTPKPKVHKPKKAILSQIRQLQDSTQTLLRKAPFQRIVRDLANQQETNDIRWQSEALNALQEAAENYMTELFEDANLLCLHAKRVTLFESDMKLVQRLRRNISKH